MSVVFTTVSPILKGSNTECILSEGIEGGREEIS